MELVAFDLETTGLSSKSDRIIEIGAIRFDASGQIIATFETLVDPGIPVPLGIQRLTGISDSDLEGQITPVEAVAQLADFAQGAVLVAHGAQFDMAHCQKIAPDSFGNRIVLDSLTLARMVVPLMTSHGLGNLARELEIVHDRPHRALPDAVATAHLLLFLAGVARGLPAATTETINQLVGFASDPALSTFFTAMVAGAPAGRVMPVPRRARADAPPPQFRPDKSTALPEAAAALLSPDGPFGSSATYEYRDSQIEMARAVAQSLERKDDLLIEAATGVGKSMGYLAPLMLWASQPGNRGVVATNTITLQEQLADNDARRINDVLAQPLDIAILKGRNHYLSLRRWHRFLHRLLTNGGAPAEIVFALKILIWLTTTTTGDRGELRLGANETELWRTIRSDSDDCLGAGCSNWRDASCPMVAARRQAAAADLVITNHALLLSDSERQGTVLSDYQALVIDEAHRLEESATRMYGIRVRSVDVDVILTGLPTAFLQSDAARLAHEAGKRLFGDIKGLLGSTGSADGNPNSSLVLRDEESAALGTIRKSARHALQVWGQLANEIEQDEADPVHNKLSAAALRDLGTSVDLVINGVSGETDVSWLELRAEQAELHRAPVDVSGKLRGGVFEKTTTILTSATLRTYGGFEFMRNRLGIPPSAAELTLESTFDYLSQALCVIPTDIPPYDDDRYDTYLAGVVADCALRLGGRTLALFTGYGALRRISELVEQKLSGEGIAVLAQGIDGTRRQLLESFTASDRTVLCGTNSFWEGIDIPGDALQCVVIAKLPFPVPTDPVVAARSAQLRDPFRQYALPIAVLRLRQGFGRLIRHSADRGSVVLCDSRLRNRSYASAFLEALPECGFARVAAGEVGAITAQFVREGKVAVPTERAPKEGQWSEPWLQTSSPSSDEPA